MEATAQTLVTAAAPARYLDRDETIRRIRAGLKRRSGRAWSVTGGRGTAWGWIRIDTTPARRTWRHVETDDRDGAGHPIYVDTDTGEPGWYAGPEDRAELARLLDLESAHFQGVSIPSSGDYYQEYVDRAEGRPPSRFGKQYWD